MTLDLKVYNLIFRSGLFLLATLPLLVGGCKSNDSEDKLATTLKLYVETSPYANANHFVATIGRAAPFQIALESQPFLSEIYIVNASVVDTPGGFEIMIKFDKVGGWILDQYTTANKTRHLAILATFGEARWLGAPLINQRLSEGVLQFTPDATREEANRIVFGLNNVAEEVRKENRF